jgi:hypothetical protein
VVGVLVREEECGLEAEVEAQGQVGVDVSHP